MARAAPAEPPLTLADCLRAGERYDPNLDYGRVLAAVCTLLADKAD